MRILYYTIALIFSVSLFSQENIKEASIFHWNDLHAHNQPFKISGKDSATGKEISYYVGGVSNMLGYLHKYRTKSSLLLNAGDDFQGTPISNFTRGRSQIELLNLYNIDAFVLGNHEFDYGRNSLDSVLQIANFDVLSANILDSAKNTLIAKPYVIKETPGVKFGIIGITLPELFSSSLPGNISGLQMLNTDSVITASIYDLKQSGCDVIILLTHAGVENDKQLAGKFYNDVDIIVGGHSHIPLFRPLSVNGVVIVQAGANGRWLGKLDIKVDTDKDTVMDAYENLIETVMDSSLYDRSAAEKINRMMQEYQPMLKEVIGRLQSKWKASYSNESNLAQFEADAFRIKTGADIAIINGGGLRKSLPKGDITINDIWEINPFGNEIQTFTISGKTLRQMIKNNIKIRISKQDSGEGAEILETSGLNYSYDSKVARSGDEDFLLSFNLGRAEINDDDNYIIATNNFVTSQFKKFFGDLRENIEFTSTGLIDRDLIIETVKEMGVINTVLEKRIVDVAMEK